MILDRVPLANSRRFAGIEREGAPNFLKIAWSPVMAKLPTDMGGYPLDFLGPIPPWHNKTAKPLAPVAISASALVALPHQWVHTCSRMIPGTFQIVPR